MAEECLIIDDNIDNINTAASLGFQTLLYQEETAREELRKLGVL
jgi:FMN phosphatase YigB (HAD superfamily)